MLLLLPLLLMTMGTATEALFPQMQSSIALEAGPGPRQVRRATTVATERAGRDAVKTIWGALLVRDNDDGDDDHDGNGGGVKGYRVCASPLQGNGRCSPTAEEISTLSYRLFAIYATV